MFSKKPLKTFLFPAANILLSIFLLLAFYDAYRTIKNTFPFAHISSLDYMTPQPMNYFWDINMRHAPIDKKEIRFYADYYEQMLKVFPTLGETNGVLGYCYHYLGDDTKAIACLKKAIKADPVYTWNYYNLAAIYIIEARYQEAIDLLQKLEHMDPQLSVHSIFQSPFVYSPLLVEVGQDETIVATAKHLQLSYKVSGDLVDLLNQMSSSKDLEGILKRMKLELYAF